MKYILKYSIFLYYSLFQNVVHERKEKKKRINRDPSAIDFDAFEKYNLPLLS